MRSELEGLRQAVLALAVTYGYPHHLRHLIDFDARCAVLLRKRLDLSPHEAGHEEVWSYLSCCWLLDVCVWRFGSDADERRFIGNVNRNTFRRLWWRAEILGADGDPPLGGLGEDELVNVMERPNISGNPRMARAIVQRFVNRLHGDADLGAHRMQLMRDLMKRLVRLTPFVDLESLDAAELAFVIDEQLDRSVAVLAGRPAAARERPETEVPPVSDVVEVPPTAVSAPPAAIPGVGRPRELEEIAEFAVGLARRTGRVTNGTLREVFPINSETARAILGGLVEEGVLLRRGEKRGTHYVVTGLEPETQDPSTVTRTTTALRRILRRGSDGIRRY